MHAEPATCPDPFPNKIQKFGRPTRQLQSMRRTRDAINFFWLSAHEGSTLFSLTKPRSRLRARVLASHPITISQERATAASGTFLSSFSCLRLAFLIPSSSPVCENRNPILPRAGFHSESTLFFLPLRVIRLPRGVPGPSCQQNLFASAAAPSPLSLVSLPVVSGMSIFRAPRLLAQNRN